MIGGYHDSNQVHSIATCNRYPVFPMPHTEACSYQDIVSRFRGKDLLRLAAV
jgi:hypothetical protein